MIKRLLFLLSLIVINVAIARSQSLITTPSDTIVLDTTYASCQTETTLTFNVLNNTTDTLLMNWRIVYNTFPHGWTLAYCYLGTCLSSGFMNHTFQYKLNPSVTSLMQLEVTPVSGSSTGYFQVLTWVTGDSINTAKYLNYKVSINACTVSTGITEAPTTQVSFYPNPVRNQLKLTLSQNLTNGQIDIYDLIGSRVYSQPINNRETIKDFDLTTLETGIYVARISDNGKILATRKFTKED
jgi:hypothetical protein